MAKKLAPHLTRQHAIRTGITFFALTAGLAIAAPWDSGMERAGRPDLMGADADRDGKITRAEMQAQVAVRFAALDLNTDGSITGTDRELGKKAKLDAHFADMDSNKDGSISRAEFDAGHARAAAKPAKMGHKRGGSEGPDNAGPYGPGSGSGMKADMTKAQFVSMAMMRFDRFDANRDGTLDSTELQAMQKMGRRGKGSRRGHDGPESGANGNDAMGDMSYAPSMAPVATPAPVPASAPAIAPANPVAKP